MKKKIRYVGLDVHKGTIAIAVAEGRGGSPEDYMTVPNDGLALGKALAQLKLGGELRTASVDRAELADDGRHPRQRRPHR